MGGQIIGVWPHSKETTKRGQHENDYETQIPQEDQGR
jgi:hypothetical protein